jgi:hypothetical protein
VRLCLFLIITGYTTTSLKLQRHKHMAQAQLSRFTHSLATDNPGDPLPSMHTTTPAQDLLEQPALWCLHTHTGQTQDKPTPAVPLSQTNSVSRHKHQLTELISSSAARPFAMTGTLKTGAGTASTLKVWAGAVYTCRYDSTAQAHVSTADG